MTKNISFKRVVMRLGKNSSKLWITIAVVLILCILSIPLYYHLEMASYSGIKVVIDAGHGGSDRGVKGIESGVSESEINLKVTYTLKSLFEERGAEVILTRKDDIIFPNGKGSKKEDFNNRKETIHSATPSVVISIHQNKFPNQNRRGAQVFFNANNTKSIALANAVQEELNVINEREVGRKFSALKGDYFILNCSTFPSCIVECGFLSNPLDDALLNQEEYRERISNAILEGVYHYLAENNL